VRRGNWRRAATRVKKDYVWKTSSIALTGTGAGAAQYTTILTPADWQVGSTGFERATVLAIRGWLYFTNVVLGSNFPGSYAAIYKGSVTEAPSFDPRAIATYDAYDILRVFGAPGARAAVTTASDEVPHVQHVDIKSKRKVDSSENLLFAFGTAGSAAASTNAIGVLRVLVERT